MREKMWASSLARAHLQMLFDIQKFWFFGVVWIVTRVFVVRYWYQYVQCSSFSSIAWLLTRHVRASLGVGYTIQYWILSDSHSNKLIAVRLNNNNYNHHSNTISPSNFGQYLDQMRPIFDPPGLNIDQLDQFEYISDCVSWSQSPISTQSIFPAYAMMQGAFPSAKGEGNEKILSPCQWYPYQTFAFFVLIE